MNANDETPLTHAEARLFMRAIRNGWPIPPEVKARMMLRAARMALESADGRTVATGMKVILTANGQNQKEADTALAEERLALERERFEHDKAREAKLDQIEEKMRALGILEQAADGTADQGHRGGAANVPADAEPGPRLLEGPGSLPPGSAEG